MKSVGYSTFYNDNNDIDNNDIDIDDIENNDIDKEKQCLICLQGSIQSSNNIILDDVKLINEMHFLIKECKCECYSHHKCIEKWIENNSVCPICKGPISFPKSGIKEEIIQMPTNIINPQHEIIILQNTKDKNHVCIRVIIIIFLFLMVITILNNNVNV
jgi:hypothetical protein